MLSSDFGKKDSAQVCLALQTVAVRSGAELDFCEPVDFSAKHLLGTHFNSKLVLQMSLKDIHY